MLTKTDSFHLFPAVVYGGVIWLWYVFVVFCDDSYEPVIELHYYTPGIIIKKIGDTTCLLVFYKDSIWGRRLWSLDPFKKAIEKEGELEV